MTRNHILLRFVVFFCILPGVLALSCGKQSGAAKTRTPPKNTTLQAHAAPESYRFDLHLSEAKVASGPAVDASTFCHRFDFSADAAPWTVVDGKARCAKADGILAVETEAPATCDSPAITQTHADTVSAILIEARVFDCRQFTLAWRIETGEFLQGDEVPIDVAEPGSWTTYKIATGPLVGWRGKRGNVDQLRLKLPAQAKMEIRSIGLARIVDRFAGRSYGLIDYPYKRDSFHSIFIRPPSSLEYDVTVMPNARLTAGLLHQGLVPIQSRVLLVDGSDQTVLAEQQQGRAGALQKVAVDLSRWAGRKVKIRFETDSQQPGAVALWCNPTLERVYPVTAAQRPLNVIWYVIDCLRATTVSAYGHERETTPAIDAVAKEGTRFEWCFSPGSWTIDSVTSFFTGLSPEAHGMYRTRFRIPGSMTLLPEILRNSGYRTALFTQNPYLNEQRGFVRGFDVARRFRVRDTGRRDRPTVDNYSLNVGIGDFLEEYSESPFFMYVHSMEAHHPYVPPALMRVFTKPDGSTRLTDLYDDCVLWADTNLSHTINELKRQGLWNNTLLIVSADHGECFREYDNGLDGHGKEPYLSRVRVPLIMHLPGTIPEGAVIKENVQELDVPATLFELLHIEPNPQFGGQSLLGLLNGTKKAEFEQRSIFPAGERPKWQAVVKGKWFYLDNDGKGELLDLETAPQHSANVIEAHPDLAQRFLEETLEFRRAEAERGKQYKNETSQNVEIDPENRKDLEAIGYL